MKITIDLPDDFEGRLGDIGILEKRLKLITLVICDLCRHPSEVVLLAEQWGLSKGNGAWEAWLDETRALAAKEAQERAKGVSVTVAQGNAKPAPAGRKGARNV